ncbi:hypothetical protein PUN28_005175 [Cardiocondyla obscurior]|uniref:Secreted protein n=1 Tax=Cardiocondyla obscurior TaxID=286306 RepID=A0AAW2GIH8_9HYME
MFFQTGLGLFKLLHSSVNGGTCICIMQTTKLRVKVRGRAIWNRENAGHRRTCIAAFSRTNIRGRLSRYISRDTREDKWERSRKGEVHGSLTY